MVAMQRALWHAAAHCSCPNSCLAGRLPRRSQLHRLSYPLPKLHISFVEEVKPSGQRANLHLRNSRPLNMAGAGEAQPTQDLQALIGEGGRRSWRGPHGRPPALRLSRVPVPRAAAFRVGGLLLHQASGSTGARPARGGPSCLPHTDPCRCPPARVRPEYPDGPPLCLGSRVQGVPAPRRTHAPYRACLSAPRPAPARPPRTLLPPASARCRVCLLWALQAVCAVGHRAARGVRSCSGGAGRPTCRCGLLVLRPPTTAQYRIPCLLLLITTPAPTCAKWLTAPPSHPTTLLHTRSQACGHP